ncbi:MAG: VOC family protein [Xanthomonadales bacterium]|nr:VOC family protein [Xanthomonadales bacterium]
MHLEHLNLVVKDMPKTLDFYQAAFPHWQVRGGGKSDWYGHPRNWVHFGDDYQYLTFNDNGTGENRDLKSHQVGMAHFAYVAEDIKGVIERLKLAGFSEKIAYESDEYRANVYFEDPSGYEIEFVQYFNDIPHLRNQYQ